MTNGRISWRALSVLSLATLSTGANGQQSCRASGTTMPVTKLPEASGIAVSRRTPGVLWLHNDSGDPTIVAVDSEGATLGRVYVSGASGGDWEDVDVGPCPQGSCVYIADIGDNLGRRREVFLYRVAEPDPTASVSARAETMRVSYPDGPRDAEALFVLPNGSLFIVSKGELGPVALYHVPDQFRDGAAVQLERVATITEAEGGSRGRVGRPERITGAGASPDGRWVVLRTLYAITFYEASAFTAGDIRAVFAFDVSGVRERQGEGVALENDGTVWLASEGGGGKRPGTIARLACSLR
jgi:hypothetical protein